MGSNTFSILCTFAIVACATIIGLPVFFYAYVPSSYSNLNWESTPCKIESYSIYLDNNAFDYYVNFGLTPDPTIVHNASYQLFQYYYDSFPVENYNNSNLVRQYPIGQTNICYYNKCLFDPTNQVDIDNCLRTNPQPSTGITLNPKNIKSDFSFFSCIMCLVIGGISFIIMIVFILIDLHTACKKCSFNNLSITEQIKMQSIKQNERCRYVG